MCHQTSHECYEAGGWVFLVLMLVFQFLLVAGQDRLQSEVLGRRDQGEESISERSEKTFKELTLTKRQHCQWGSASGSQMCWAERGGLFLPFQILLLFNSSLSKKLSRTQSRTEACTLFLGLPAHLNLSPLTQHPHLWGQCCIEVHMCSCTLVKHYIKKGSWYTNICRHIKVGVFFT